MSSMVGNSGSKELADARMRLAMSRHQVRSFVRRQEKVGSQSSRQSVGADFEEEMYRVAVIAD